MQSTPDAPMRPDHLAQQVGRRFMALLLPVALVMGIVVWSTANLSPIYADAADRYAVLTPPDDGGNTTTSDGILEKLLDSALNAVVVVVLVLLTTLLIVLLYYCRCSFVLYGWFMFSSVSIFFVMAWVWLDLVLTRFQIPYSTPSMALVLWNLAVCGTVAMFFYAHPAVTQGSLLFASVLVAWSLTALPSWTAWSVLLAIALYDVAAVLCPGGPLRLLINLAQQRGDPIPGFVYDTDSEVHAFEPARAAPATEPASRPTSTASVAVTGADHEATAARPPTTATTAVAAREAAHGTAVPIGSGAHLSREEARELDADHDEDLPDGTPAAPPRPRHSSSSPSLNGPEQTAIEHIPPIQTVQRVFDSLSPTQQVLALCGAPFKLGLGDFIFYSMLVGVAYLAGSFVAWTAPFLVVLSGMVTTLASLLIYRGRGALPALPISIFAASLMFLLCRVSLGPFVEGAASLNLVL